MIALVLVIGLAVALSVAGWVPLVRDALRVERVLPGPGVVPVAGPAADDVDPRPAADPVPA